MTTTSAPRVIRTTDGRYAFLENTRVVVVAGSHDFDGDRRSISVNNIDDDNVVLTAADGDRHAAFFLSRDEARLFAQTVLEATATASASPSFWARRALGDFDDERGTA